MRENDVVVLEMITGFEARSAGMIEKLQLGREARGFFFPVKHEGSRHHHERRPRHGIPIARARLAARFEQRQHLNRLPQPHVVGQTAAETEALQKKEPAQSLALITSQFTLKLCRRQRFADSGKAAQFLAQALERRVARLPPARKPKAHPAGPPAGA